MDFTIPAEYQELVDKAVALAAEFAPRARAYDEQAAFPAENFARLRQEGFLKLTVPRELGGYGLWRDQRYIPFYMILAALAEGDASTGQLVQIQSHASGIVGYLGNEEQQRRILGDVVARGALIASCGSEANPRVIGPGKIQSELEPAPGGFRLTGVKHFASLAPEADYFVVYVMAPGSSSVAEGYTTVIVPRTSEGVSFEDTWDVMGMRATISWALHLDNVFVPWENVLGQPGDWVQHDPRTFTLAYVANHLGAAQGVFNFVVDYLKPRPFLVKDDTIAFTLGEMDSMLQATRTSMWYAGWLWEQNRYEEAEKASMRALHSAKQTALNVATKAFDIVGARGGFKDNPLDRSLRDIRMFSLHFRESQLMRMLAEADLGEPFHSKQKYGPKLERQSWEKLAAAATSDDD